MLLGMVATPGLYFAFKRMEMEIETNGVISSRALSFRTSIKNEIEN